MIAGLTEGRAILVGGWLSFSDAVSIVGGPVGWEILLPCVFLAGGVRLGLRVGATLALAMVTNPLFKWMALGPRPYFVSDEVVARTAATGLGMPSGHAQGVAAIWGGLAAFSASRGLTWLAGIVILLTGLSRIHLGVHSLLQVLVGWLLGGLCVAAVAVLDRPLVSWLRSLTVPTRLVLAATLPVLVLAVGWAIAEGLRGDFVVPAEWQRRGLAAAERLGRPGSEVGDLRLIEFATMIPRAGTVLGLALCGVWTLSHGCREPRSSAERLVNLAWGLPAVIVWSAFWGLGSLVLGFEWAEALRRAGLPLLVGVVIPAWTLGR